MAKPANDKSKNALGAGRTLIAVYAVFALAATVRSAYQVATNFSASPVNYSLSVVSGLIYILATIALAKNSDGWRRVAKATVTFELAGVIVVGVYSLIFPVANIKLTSVWSYFGMYYLFIPLILPILGLLWLRKRDRA